MVVTGGVLMVLWSVVLLIKTCIYAKLQGNKHLLPGFIIISTELEKKYPIKTQLISLQTELHPVSVTY